MGPRRNSTAVDERLVAFLREWLGQWPPDGALTVVGDPARTRPAWDGSVRDVIGVASPDGAVVSVTPDRADAVRAAADASWSALPRVLPDAMGRPEAGAFIGTFRWTTTPTDLPDAGVWLAPDDPRLPEWLTPFGAATPPSGDARDPRFGTVLVALDGDRYAAGVGLKHHNRYGVELAVGTDPDHRGRGLAARLCAQAARHIVARGAAAIYLHDPANVASGRTGAAAGFPDDGWQVLGMTPPVDPGP